MIRLWRRTWSEFVPFLDYDVEIRTVICPTNAIWVLTRPVGVMSRAASIGRP